MIALLQESAEFSFQLDELWANAWDIWRKGGWAMLAIAINAINAIVIFR